MFLCFINYSTLTTDQRIQATLYQNVFENVHTMKVPQNAILVSMGVTSLFIVYKYTARRRYHDQMYGGPEGSHMQIKNVAAN